MGQKGVRTSGYTKKKKKWFLKQIIGFTGSLRIVYVASYVYQELFYIAERVFVGDCSVMQ